MSCNLYTKWFDSKSPSEILQLKGAVAGVLRGAQQLIEIWFICCARIHFRNSAFFLKNSKASSLSTWRRMKV